MNMNRRRLRVAGKVVAQFWMIVFLAMGGVRYYYTRSMPAEPDPQSGKTVAVAVFYGKTVYVDDVEAKVLHGLDTTLVVVTVVLLAVGFAWRLRRLPDS